MDSFPYPWLLVVETHNYCNSKCSFCPSLQMKRPRGFMSDENFEFVVNELSSMQINWIQLQPMGGEPLLDQRIIKQAQQLKNMVGSFLRTHTNLMALHRYSEDDIVNILRAFDHIYVSIAPNEYAHKVLFGLDNYNMVVSNLDKLSSLKQKYGLDVLIKMLGRSAPEAGDVDATLYSLAKQINQDKIGWTTEYCDWGGHTTDLPLGAKVLRADKSGKRISPCRFALWPAIFWNMDVGICACADYDAHLVVGNLNEDSLETILKSSRRSKMVASFLDGKMPAYCTKCTFYQPAENMEF